MLFCIAAFPGAFVAVEEISGIPVVTLNYDGTGKNINQKVRPYIKYPRNKLKQGASS